MKSQNLLLAILLLFSLQLSASHYIGGEVYWRCIQGTGKYIFYLDYYRDCGSTVAPQLNVSLSVSNTPRPNSNSLANIPMTFIPPDPGSPVGPFGGLAVQPTCQGCAGSSPISCVVSDDGTLEKFSFRSQPITLAGKPPSGNANDWLNGWVFSWQAPCCRSSDVTNIQNTGTTALFKAIMYGDGRASQDPCYDNSPEFKELPASLICDEYDFQFNHNATDLELDSLNFSWANVVSSTAGTNYTPVFNQWASGFSINNPTPNAAADSRNKPATIDPKSGAINMFVVLPANVGPGGNKIYVTSARVDAYGYDVNGNTIRKASIFRDMPFNIFNCPKNTFTYQDSSGNPININEVNTAPYIKLNSTAGALNFDTTIYAGDDVSIAFLAEDSNVSRCSPTLLTEVTVEPLGFQFDKNFNDPQGNCPIKPCATLTPAPTGRPARLMGNAYVETQFNWRADCAHLYSNDPLKVMNDSRMFQFIFKVTDDFCPVPAVTYASLNVTVKLPKTPKAPKVYCFDTSNGNLNYTYELLNYNANRFHSVEVYIGQRLKGSLQAFSFIGIPIQYTKNYTGSGFIPMNQLDPNQEYAIRLKHRDSICTWDVTSQYSNVISAGQTDTVQFNLNYKDSTLSLSNPLNGILKWYKNGVLIANASGNAIIISDTGRYEVEVTIGGCVFRSQPYIISVVSSKELNSSISELSIYPNPTNGNLSISGLHENESIKSVSVYNLNGQLEALLNSGSFVDLSVLPKQLYILRIETNWRVVTKKILKQ